MKKRQPSILIVDDNTTFVMYLGLLLRRLDFAVLTAPSADEALALIAEQQVDALICEGRTATFDGLKLLHALRKNVQFSKIPVIVIATHGSQSDRTAFLASGANDFLSKPVTPAQLHRSLHEFIRIHGSTRRYPRVRLNHPVHVESSRGSENLFLTSLSEGGAFIRHDSPLASGEKITIHFTTLCGTQLALRGHVLYNRHMFETPEIVEPGFAVHFRPLPLTEKRLLCQYIDQMLAGDLEPFPTSPDMAQPA